MNTIVTYVSFHHHNTEKVAKRIASVLEARLAPLSKISKEDLLNAGLVGFGSGVYMSKMHKSVIDFVDSLPAMEGKDAFIFSTSGIRKNFLFNKAHSHMKEKLEKKGFRIVGEFDCRGFDTYGPLRFIGGINRKRPNEKDLKRAEEFARSLFK